MEDGKPWLVGGSLNYNTVLQLDQFCGKQGLRVEIAYVWLFFSLQYMSDICPKVIDLGMIPSAPSCPPILPPYVGLQTEETESQRILPPLPLHSVISVKPKTEIQTAEVDVQRTPVSVLPQTTLISTEAQTFEVREAQIAKTKGEIQDEMEDWRQRDKENHVFQSIPGIICTEQPERLKNSHTSCSSLRSTHWEK